MQKYMTYVGNQLTTTLRNEKSQYLKKVIQNPGNSQTPWKMLNIILNRSKTTYEQTYIINVNGKIVADLHDIAEQFNIYFTNIGMNHILNSNCLSDNSVA